MIKFFSIIISYLEDNWVVDPCIYLDKMFERYRTRIYGHNIREIFGTENYYSYRKAQKNKNPLIKIIEKNTKLPKWICDATFQPDIDSNKRFI